MKFLVNFSNNISITYDLVDETIVDIWAEEIKHKTIDNVCKINHYIGYAEESVVHNYIQRLYELSDLINLRVPDRVIKKEINKDTWKKALHVMHIHFPDLKLDKNYIDIWPLLSEYNDIIHWLESILCNMWANTNLTESSLFRITLDLNKTTKSDRFLPIPEEAYKLFDPNINFGDLSLHYVHVGKHAWELFIVNDLICQPDQFVPQVQFTASCRMLFTDYFHNTEIKKQTLQKKWEKFYIDRGGYEFWGANIDDPKIAFGYLKIGQLFNISIDGVDIPIPVTIDELCNFRKQLVKTRVINWEII
jgi:hypothetical protein